MASDVSVMCMVTYSTDSSLHQLTLESTLDELISGICETWRFLDPNLIQLKYDDGCGKVIVVDCSTQLKALVSLVAYVTKADFLRLDLHTLAEPSLVDMLIADVPQIQPTLAATLPATSSECGGGHIVLKRQKKPVVTTLASTSASQPSTLCERGFNGKPCTRTATKADAWANIITGVGQIFYGGRDEARLVVEKYNHYWGRKVKVVKSDDTRYTVECIRKVSGNCGWRFHASSKSTGLNPSFVLKQYHGEHNCGAGYNDLNSSITKALVKDCVIEQVRLNPNKKPSDIVKDFKSDYGLNISYDQAYAGKLECVKELFGDDSKSYTDLMWFVDAVKRTNPGSVADLVTDPVTNQFKSLFLSFAASIYGFQFCRAVLFLDGTFLTGGFRGCLMAATGKDANNGTPFSEKQKWFSNFMIFMILCFSQFFSPLVPGFHWCFDPLFASAYFLFLIFLSSVFCRHLSFGLWYRIWRECGQLDVVLGKIETCFGPTAVINNHFRST